MKGIGELASAAAGKIQTGRKAPKIEQASTYQAARSTAPPLVVLPIRVLDNPTVANDANCLRVLIAIANHANKAGMTHCSQERVAALSKLSRKTVGRKLKLLTAAGLVKIEYRRPYAGSPKRLNVMRVIYDDGTLTRQDAQSIAGTATPKGQPKRVPQVNGHATELSTGALQHHATYETHIESPTSNLSTAMGQVDDPPMGQIKGFTSGTPIESPAEQPKGLNKGTHGQTDYTHDDVIKIWRSSVRALGAEAMPNEGDHETIEQLRGQGITLQAIRGEISDYCLDLHDKRQAPASRLRAIVAPLLSVR